METGIRFDAIKIGGKTLPNCDLIFSKSDHRLYVLKLPSEHGFLAIAVRFVYCCPESNDVWDCPDLIVEPIFNVAACFD